MHGIEISKNYYETFGIPMIRDEFLHLESKLAFGLVGSGSECFGYDDDVSKDHDFDPGFIIFISDDISEDTKFKLERAYAKLPREYEGYKREIMSPVGGNRRGVKRVSDFLKEKTGKADAALTIYDWLTIKDSYLAELTNGEIWKDDSNIINSYRLKLSTYPEDIKLKKLSGELLVMAQSGQYNFERCVSHKEYGAAKLSLYEFVNASIHATFLINEVYMPFYKWKFRALRDLSWPMGENISEVLESLLSTTDEKITSGNIKKNIDYIAKLFVERLKADALSKIDDLYLEKHAYEVNNRIKNNDIRNMNILVAV